MREHPGQERTVRRIPDTELPASFFDNLGQRWVMHVTYAREKMMLNLEVESAQQPAENPARAAKVHGGLDLMHVPRMLHALGVRRWQGILGLFHAMGQLEYHGHCDPQYPRHDQVE